MFLFNFLVAIFVSNLFQILNCLYRFLCKFADIHDRKPPFNSEVLVVFVVSNTAQRNSHPPGGLIF